MTPKLTGGANEAWPRILTIALLTLYVLMVLVLGSQVDRTSDERNYMAAGRVIAVEGWTHPATVLHGPLPFYANQLFLNVDDLPSGINDDKLIVPRGRYQRGRLGMLPFGLLSALIISAWARRLWGRWAGVFGLALFVSHPLMPAYGALVAVDMAYCAGVLLALFAAWYYARSPVLWRAGLVGIAVGTALATKYLALLLAPIALLAVLVKAQRSGNGWRRTLLTTTFATGIALAALWACYGFGVRGAPSDAASYRSSIGAATEIPGVGLALGMLPEPWVRGIDFQFDVGSNSYSVYLRGRYGPGHKDYYFWTFLIKTPEWIIALSILGIALGVHSLRRGPPGADVQAAFWVIVPACLVLLIYISCFTSLQLGVRYMLPVFPLGAILLAGLAPALGRAFGSWGGRSVLILFSLGWLVGVADTLHQWPNLLSYTNILSGGQHESWRYFNDSNTEWNQTDEWARKLIDNRGDTKRLGDESGPQFGRLGISVSSLTKRDTVEPSRSRHWIDIFEPVESVGTSWLVFDVDAESWIERIDEIGDEQRRLELAFALLAADRSKDAERVTTPLSGEQLQLWKKFKHRVSNKSPTPKQSLLAARSWVEVGRGDQALKALQGMDPGTVEVGIVQALALVIEGRDLEADAILSALINPGPAALSLHIEILQRLWQHERALTLLKAALPHLEPKARARLEMGLEVFKREVADREIMRRVAGVRPSTD